MGFERFYVQGWRKGFFIWMLVFWVEGKGVFGEGCIWMELLEEGLGWYLDLGHGVILGFYSVIVIWF